MATYVYKPNGARVTVADGKAMDPREWERADKPAKKPARRKAAPKGSGE